MKKGLILLMMLLGCSTTVQAQEYPITIQNQSAYIVNGVRIFSESGSEKDQVMNKAYIPSGEERKYSIQLWPSGKLRIKVHYRKDGTDHLSDVLEISLGEKYKVGPLSVSFKGKEGEHW